MEPRGKDRSLSLVHHRDAGVDGDVAHPVVRRSARRGPRVVGHVVPIAAKYRHHLSRPALQVDGGHAVLKRRAFELVAVHRASSAEVVGDADDAQVGVKAARVGAVHVLHDFEQELVLPQPRVGAEEVDWLVWLDGALYQALEQCRARGETRIDHGPSGL